MYKHHTSDVAHYVHKNKTNFALNVAMKHELSTRTIKISLKSLQLWESYLLKTSFILLGALLQTFSVIYKNDVLHRNKVIIFVKQRLHVRPLYK